MGKLTSSPDLGSTRNHEELARFVTIILDDIFDQINGRIEFEKNIYARIVSVNFPTANVEVRVPHTLNRVSNGYYLIGSDVAMSLYDGVSINEVNVLFLRSNQSGNARVLIF